MDSFEWNKILGAILGTLLFLFIVKEAAHIIYPSEEEVEELAYKIEIPETEAGQAGDQKPEAVDFGTLLQQASAEQGEAVAKRCLQCHTFDKGGAHKTGPNLWGIVGADIAAEPDFRYSNALSKLEGEWTYERIYEFVGAPSRYVPGTNMNFAGLRRQQERINLLAYLRTRADEPPPIPEPLPEEAEEGAEATEGEASPQGGTDGAAATESGEGKETGSEDAEAEGDKAAAASDEEDGPSGDEASPAGGGAEEEGSAEGESVEENAQGNPENEAGNGAP